jgi:hypothetical protein
MIKEPMLALLFALSACMAEASDYVQPYNPESTESMRVYPDLSSAGDYGYILLGPPQVPNAVATVTYYNTPVHGPSDSEDFTLTFEGLTVTISYEWTSGDDSVEVTPPPYYQVEPQGMVAVPEGQTQLYHIYQLLG